MFLLYPIFLAGIYFPLSDTILMSLPKILHSVCQ